MELNGNGHATLPSLTDRNGQLTINSGDFEQLKGDLFRLVSNEFLLTRDALNKALFDPRRDVFAECGYAKNPTLEAFVEMYERSEYAKTCVDLYPNECWKVHPLVYEEEEADTITAFEEAWDNLGRQLRGEQSWYGEEADNPVWHYLQRLDKESGLGRYGCLLIGIDDGKPLDQPVEGLDEQGWSPQQLKDMAEGGQAEAGMMPLYSGVGTERQYWDWQRYSQEPYGGSNGNGKPTNGQAKQGKNGRPDGGKGKQSTKRRKVTYLRTFPEHLAPVTSFEQRNCPRYGQPLLYQVTFNDPRQNSQGGASQGMGTKMVHWHRMLHVADVHFQAPYNEWFARPRQQVVFNSLWDLLKIKGSAAEGFWQAAFTILAYETHPQLGTDVQVNVTDLKSQFEQLMNGLKRWVASTGGSFKSIAPSVTDPTGHATLPIKAICNALRCPVRVFEGSERGELASSQDDAAWNERVRERQKNYLTPRIIIPFIDRLIQLKVLPEPQKPKQVMQQKPKVKLAAPGGGPGGPPGAGGPPGGGFGGGKPGGPPKPPTANAFQPQFAGKKPTSPKPEDMDDDELPTEPDDQAQVAEEQGQAGADQGADEQGRVGAALGEPAGEAPAGAVAGVDGDPELDQELDPATGEPMGHGTPKMLGGYRIEWPDVAAMSANEKSQVATQQTGALAQYVSGDLQQLIPPLDYLTRVMGWEEDEALAMLSEAEAAQLEQEAADQHLAAQLPPQPTVDEEGNPLPPQPGAPGQPPQAGQGPPKLGQPPALGGPKGQPPGAAGGLPKPPQFGKPPVGNANPEGCNQYTGPNCANLPSDQKHVLEQLKSGEKSVQYLHKLQPGVGSAHGMYHKTVMPAKELETAGLIERVGTVQGHIGIGAGYAGPGSASAKDAEKGDEARIIYKLSAKGRAALGMEPEAKVADTYDRTEDFKSRDQHARVMLSSAKKELARVSGKPRLEKQAREKIAKHEAALAKLKKDFPDLAANRSLDQILNAGDNCGTGAGGFASGNDCGKGDGQGGDDDKALKDAEGKAELASKEKAAQDASAAKEGEQPQQEEIRGDGLPNKWENPLDDYKQLAKDVAALPVEFAKNYANEFKLRVFDQYVKRAYQSIGPDQAEDAKGIAWGIFSRLTLGMGPLGYNAVRFGIKYGPPAFRMFTSATRKLGRAAGWAAKTGVRGARQLGADLTGGYSSSGTPLAPAVNADFVESVQKAAESLKRQGLMPGYGQVFWKPETAELWYVGGDGDERGFSVKVKDRLGRLVGNPRLVTYEAEGFPPKDDGWEQVYPKKRQWVKLTANNLSIAQMIANAKAGEDFDAELGVNSNPEGCNQYTGPGCGHAGHEPDWLASANAVAASSKAKDSASHSLAAKLHEKARDLSKEGTVEYDEHEAAMWYHEGMSLSDKPTTNAEERDDAEIERQTAKQQGEQGAPAPQAQRAGGPVPPAPAPTATGPDGQRRADAGPAADADAQAGPSGQPGAEAGAGAGLDDGAAGAAGDDGLGGPGAAGAPKPDAKLIEQALGELMAAFDRMAANPDEAKQFLKIGRKVADIIAADEGDVEMDPDRPFDDAERQEQALKQMQEMGNEGQTEWVEATAGQPAGVPEGGATATAGQAPEAGPTAYVPLEQVIGEEEDREAKAKPTANELTGNDCGTGAGGFQSGNTCGKGDGSGEDKAQGEGRSDGKRNPFESRGGVGKKPEAPKPPVAQHAPPTAKHAPADAKAQEREAGYWRDIEAAAPKELGLVGKIGKAISDKLSETAKSYYDALSNSTADGGFGPTVGGAMQRVIDFGLGVHHKLEGAYDAGQRLAHAVAKERGYSDFEANRAAKILALGDGVSRWTGNWKAVESAAVGLGALGGPVGLATAFGAAKLSYYVPVASLAYVGFQMGRHAAEGKNPFKLIKDARARVKRIKARGMARNAARTAYTDLKDWTRDVLQWLSVTGDDDLAEALLVAALDEAQGDKSRALELAKEAYEAGDGDGPDEDETDGGDDDEPTVLADAGEGPTANEFDSDEQRRAFFGLKAGDDKARSPKSAVTDKGPPRSAKASPVPRQPSPGKVDPDAKLSEAEISKATQFEGYAKSIAIMAARSVELGSSKGLTLRDGDKLAAVASYKIKGKDLYVGYLASGRKGAGTEALAQLAGLAASKGKRLVLEGQASARGFYEKMGMKALGTGTGNIGYELSVKDAKALAEKHGVTVNGEPTANYDDDQPRADDGKWTSGGSRGSGGEGKADRGGSKLAGATVTQMGRKGHVHLAEQGGKRYVVKEQRPGSSAENELAVSRMAKLAGVNVPDASMEEHNGRPALVMDRVDGKTLDQTDGKAIPKDQVDRQLAFDLLVGARDRHEGQYLWDGRQLHAIDHDLTFTPQGRGIGEALRDNVLARLSGMGHKPDKGILREMADKADALARQAPASARKDILHRGKLLREAADKGMNLNQLALHMSQERGWLAKLTGNTASRVE